MAERLSPSRNDIISYAEATILKGEKKSVAYKRYINSSAKNASSAALNFEKRKDFKAIANVLSNDQEIELIQLATGVKKKFLKLMEKNISATDRTLDIAAKIDKDDGTAKNSAMAIRLANETIQAMGGLTNISEPPPRTQENLDYSGLIE